MVTPAVVGSSATAGIEAVSPPLTTLSDGVVEAISAESISVEVTSVEASGVEACAAIIGTAPADEGVIAGVLPLAADRPWARGVAAPPPATPREGPPLPPPLRCDIWSWAGCGVASEMGIDSVLDVRWDPRRDRALPPPP